MEFLRMPKLKIGSKTVEMPVVQGGMGVGISLSKLGAAVANNGGVGVIAANAIGMIEPDYEENGSVANIRALKNEILKAKEKSNGIIGVNLMVAVNDFQELLDVTIEAEPDIIFLGAGLPIKGIPVKKIRKYELCVFPIISSARAATLILRSWDKKYSDIPDGFVLEGPKAGGHLGFKIEDIDDPAFSLESLIPQLVTAVIPFEQKYDRSIPIIAGGGIYSGADVYKTLSLGASGVQMATRFVATHECDADIRFKQSYVNAKEEDITIIKSPVGLPGRAIKNSFLEDISNGVKKLFRCPWKCLASCDAGAAKYCISEALDNARKGEMDKGFAFAGSNVHRIDKIVSVKELMSSLKKEYLLEAMKKFGSLNEYAEVVEQKVSNIAEEYEKAVARVAEIRGEYSKKIDLWKEEYQRMKDRASEAVNQKKQSYYQAYENTVVNLKKEYVNAKRKLNEVKNEMEQATERVQELKNNFPEISDYFASFNLGS